MKRIKYLAGAAIIVAIVVVLLSLDRDNADKVVKKDKQSEKDSQIVREVQELCSKYNAVTNWRQNSDANDLFQEMYTIQVEDALIRTDNRPILFYGSVKDIVRESDKYLVYFGSGGLAQLLSLSGSGLDSILNLLYPEIYFVLNCTPDQVEKILLKSAGYFEYYAVIAKIGEVKKVRFKLSADVGEHEEDVSVYIKSSSNVFIAKGKCLDLLFVGDEPEEKGE